MSRLNFDNQYMISPLSTEDLGKEVADSLNKSGMIGQVLFVKCDISNEDDVKVMLLY